MNEVDERHINEYNKLCSLKPEHRFVSLKILENNGANCNTIFCEICRTRLHVRNHNDGTISWIMKDGKPIPDECLDIEQIKDLITIGTYYEEKSLFDNDITNEMHRFHSEKHDLFESILDIKKNK